MAFDLLLIQERGKVLKLKRKIETICIFFKKSVAEIKHISIEQTSTKPICSEPELGHGDSQETNEAFDF